MKSTQTVYAVCTCAINASLCLQYVLDSWDIICLVIQKHESMYIWLWTDITMDRQKHCEKSFEKSVNYLFDMNYKSLKISKSYLSF